MADEAQTTPQSVDQTAADEAAKAAAAADAEAAKKIREFGQRFMDFVTELRDAQLTLRVKIMREEVIVNGRSMNRVEDEIFIDRMMPQESQAWKSVRADVAAAKAGIEVEKTQLVGADGQPLKSVPDESSAK